MLLYHTHVSCRAIVSCSNTARPHNAAASLSVIKLPYPIVCSAAAGAGNVEEEPVNPSTTQQQQQQQQQQPTKEKTQHGWIGRIKRALLGGQIDKAKLAEYGMGAFAAYGILSNLNAGVLVTLAWLAVVKQTGLTPVDPGQWPKFLAIYAGLYLTTNLLRPVRLTLALTAAPFLNMGLDMMQRVLRVNKATAFAIMLFGIAITSFGGIATAIILCGGFPNGIPALPWQN